MPITVTIDGNSVQIDKGSLSVDGWIEERSVASFSVVDTAGSADYVRGMPVLIYDADVVKIYSGFIDTPGRARQGAVGSVLLHDIVCMDNHYLADKRLVIQTYTTQTLAFIVNDILTNYLADEGITVGEIQTGPTIKSAIFNYVKASDCFDSLKEISGMIWYIDQDLKLYFIDRATNAAPFDLDMADYKPIKGSVHLSTGNILYRNKQYIRGGTGLTAEQTEVFTGDAVTLAFTVGYQISTVPTVTVVDRAAQTVGIKGIDTGKDCYWNKGDATIIFAIAPENTKDVTIVYFGQFPLIALAAEPGEIGDRATIEGTTGIVEEIATEAQHDTTDAIKESAKAKITEFARAAEKFTYRTHSTGLAPGQLQEITYSPFGFSAKEMLIESVGITAIGDLIIYDISCITGPRMGSWSKFFSGLLKRQDNMVKIGDSLLLALFQQSETLPLVEATDLHSDDFSDGETQRWIAEPPAQAVGHNIQHEQLDLVEATAIVSNDTENYAYGPDVVGSGASFPYSFPFIFFGPTLAGGIWDFSTWG